MGRDRDYSLIRPRFFFYDYDHLILDTGDEFRLLLQWNFRVFDRANVRNGDKCVIIIRSMYETVTVGNFIFEEWRA
jgi:hypothetical protein